jgi:guanylate kinase
MKEGKLFVISGPSGAGKGTICKGLFSGGEDPGAPVLSISMTTRKPRPGEVDGVSYRFVTEDAFRSMISLGGFLEYAEVFGNLYGTPKEPVMRILAEGRDVLLEIDVQGALQVKRNCPDSILIFILPPSLGEQKRRIKGRGAESAEQVEERVGKAVREIEAVGSYDYAVVNDNIRNAIAEVKAIMAGRRARLTPEEAEDIAGRFSENAASVPRRGK